MLLQSAKLPTLFVTMKKNFIGKNLMLNMSLINALKYVLRMKIR